MRHIRKCTITEGQQVTGNDKWSANLDELDKVIGPVIARGVIGGRILPIKGMWSVTWGCNLLSKTMNCERFLEIMKYL